MRYLSGSGSRNSRKAYEQRIEQVLGSLSVQVRSREQVLYEAWRREHPAEAAAYDAQQASYAADAAKRRAEEAERRAAAAEWQAKEAADRADSALRDLRNEQQSEQRNVIMQPILIQTPQLSPEYDF